jgi:GDP-L-fucose synthase
MELTLDSRICVAGHRGLVGSAVVRRLSKEGYRRVEGLGREAVDLRDPAATAAWFREHRPEFVFVAASTVGGIQANIDRPADFLRDNALIALNLVEAAREAGTKKLLYLASSCAYPRECRQPMRVEDLLSGPLEPTNEAYALAKLMGLKLCQAYRTQFGSRFVVAIPANLYGPGDSYDLRTAHVLPALLRRFHEARAARAASVALWGSGRPRREFMHVDDLADALLFLMRRYDAPEPVNVGVGEDLSIAELAEKIRDLVAPGVRIEWDTAKPDGMPRKLLDVSKLRAMGWSHRIGLDEGLRTTYARFVSDSRGGTDAPA